MTEIIDRAEQISKTLVEFKKLNKTLNELYSIQDNRASNYRLIEVLQISETQLNTAIKLIINQLNTINNRLRELISC